MAFGKRLGLGAALAFSSLAFVACGSSDSPYGEDPDFNSVRAKFDNPTGTLSANNSASVLGSFDAQKASSESANVGGVSGSSAGSDGSDATTAGGVATQALRMLAGSAELEGADASTSTQACSDLVQGHESGSCQCPNGGSFIYDFSGLRNAAQQKTGPLDITLRLRLNQCGTDALTLDGREFFKMKANRDARGRLDASTLSLLLVADFVAKTATSTHDLSLTALIEGDSFWVTAAVDDGWVVVGGKKTGANSGELTIRAKNGSWTCTSTNGKGTCTANTGESFEFDKS